MSDILSDERIATIKEYRTNMTAVPEPNAVVVAACSCIDELFSHADALAAKLKEATALAGLRKGWACANCKAEWSLALHGHPCPESTHRENWPHEWMNSYERELQGRLVVHLNSASESTEREQRLRDVLTRAAFPLNLMRLIASGESKSAMFTPEVAALVVAALADAPAAQPSEAERLMKALSAIDELMPVAGMLPECDLSDDALVYQGSAMSENWRCHVPMGVVAIWPQLPEPIRLLVFLCCFPVSQHRCGGYAEAATYAAGLTRLRGVLGKIRRALGGYAEGCVVCANIDAILTREGI